MVSRTVEIKGLRLSLDVPERYLPEPLRRLVRRGVNAVHPPREQEASPLCLAPGEVPAIRFEPRDTDRALAFLQDGIDRHDLPGAHPASVTSTDTDARTLAEQVASYPWYHTIELPHGIVTPGAYDHRPLLPHYGIPADLTGQRVLDVATNDGFWAFEFERRGGTVTGLDIDTIADLDLPARAAEVAAEREMRKPLSNGFALAHRALASKVERVPGTVYDLDPDRMGRFDLVHSGDLLIHLRDPCRALEHIRSVTAGQALLSEVFDPDLGASEPRLVRYLGGSEMVGWWMPSLDTLVQMVADAGFSSIELVTVHRLPQKGSHQGPSRAVLRARP